MRIEVHETPAIAHLAANVSGVVTIYSACSHCRPILTVHTGSRWSDDIR